MSNYEITLELSGKDDDVETNIKCKGEMSVSQLRIGLIMSIAQLTDLYFQITGERKASADIQNDLVGYV